MIEAQSIGTFTPKVKIRHYRCSSLNASAPSPGQSLQGEYSERAAARTIRAVLKVVAHCHSLHICHRDLKLSNFLLADPFDATSIKAADFGTAVICKPGEGRGGGGGFWQELALDSGRILSQISAGGGCNEVAAGPVLKSTPQVLYLSSSWGWDQRGLVKF